MVVHGARRRGAPRRSVPGGRAARSARSRRAARPRCRSAGSSARTSCAHRHRVTLRVVLRVARRQGAEEDEAAGARQRDDGGREVVAGGRGQQVVDVARVDDVEPARAGREAPGRRPRTRRRGRRVERAAPWRSPPVTDRSGDPAAEFGGQEDAVAAVAAADVDDVEFAPDREAQAGDGEASELAWAVAPQLARRRGSGRPSRQPPERDRVERPPAPVTTASAVARPRGTSRRSSRRRRRAAPDRARLVPVERLELVAHELLVEARLALAGLVVVRRPEARRVGREHLVDEDAARRRAGRTRTSCPR